MSTLAVEKRNVAQEMTPPRWLYRVIFVCFYLSGTAGLIYQVSWMKALGLLFGRTTYAITAVLGAFMAGLALGSWLLGRYAERTRHPLRLYGWIELGIALTGLGTLAGIWLTQRIYVQVYQVIGDQTVLLLAYHFVASFLVLLVPTTLMGGTYPVVVKYLTRRSEELGTYSSRLYWLNTAGAITGASLAGFALLWHFGLVRTLVTAAVLNLVVAAMIFASSRRLGERQTVTVPEVPRAPTGQEADLAPPRAWLILLVTGVSGFTSMMFEISWTRILAIFLGSTTYAFTLMLATFLLGITLGSYLFERWHPRWQLGHALLGRRLTLLALGGVLFVAMSAELAELTRWLARAAGDSGEVLLASQFLVCFPGMILPATLFGMIFPLTVVLYCGQDRHRGARSGTLYAVNTLGAILGATITGLFLIQWLGTVNTSLVGSGLIAALAIPLFLGSNAGRSWRRAGVSLGVLLMVAGAGATKVFVHPLLYGLGIVANATRPEYRSRLTVAEIVAMDKLLYAREGVSATVAVAHRQGYVTLRTNGKTEASSGVGDQYTWLLPAYLPLSFHPHPRRVLVVGFGSGATVYAATQFAGVDRVDCIEIEPAVLGAAPFLDEINHGVYRSPKVRIILDDAHNYLAVSKQRYDVIISEPSYLWSAGISSLFTRDFYHQVREHLEPGGLFVQWLQAYQIAPTDVATVVRTLGSTFEQISMWRGSVADYILLASPTPRRFALKPLEAEYSRNAELQRMLALYLSVNEPLGLLGYYLLDDASLRQLAAKGDLNTDDRNLLEYRTPFSILKETNALNHSIVRSFRRETLPPFVDVEDSHAALLAAAETQVRLGMLRHPLGAPLLFDVLSRGPESERTLLLAAQLALFRRQPLTALEILRRAARLVPRNPEVAFMLGQLYASEGQAGEARKALEKCLELSPQHLLALGALVDLETAAGHLERAIEVQQKKIRATYWPELYAEWARLGELHLSAGQTQPALDAFEQALVLEPLCFVALGRVADLLVQSGKLKEAVEEYRFLIQYYPAESPRLYLELSQLYQRLGDARSARQTLEKAKRIFPASPEIELALWRAAPS